MVAWFWGLVERIFPPSCVSCTAPGRWWCSACASQVVPVIAPGCPICPRRTADGSFCQGCHPQSGLAGVLAGAYLRPPFTALVKALKYRHATAVVPELVALMLPALARHPRLERAVLVPVPLHPRRLAKRGHNQAMLLVRALSRTAGIPVAGQLRRERHTPSQTGLDRRTRRGNVAGAFRWHGPPPEGRTVLIVDDVVTTTATLDACAEACRKAGIRESWGLVAGKR